MTIRRAEWLAYVNRMSAIDRRAAEIMRQYIERYGLSGTEELIARAYAVATRYGEASAALACEMYDAVSAASAAGTAAAEPAATASMEEVARTVNGTLAKSQNTEMIAASIERLVKLAGADTILQNARRDGAQFAWVPNGDTCAFCLTLASNGWQPAKKGTDKAGHALHIHANCDCTYAVRFNEEGGVDGYDPQRYLDMYMSADLDGQAPTPENRINAMRREFYARDKAEINAQKRSAYAKRRELERANSDELS